MTTTIENTRIETILKDLFNAFSVRGIKGHKEIFIDAKNAFINYFENNKKEIILYIQDNEHAFGINILSGKDLVDIVSVTEKSFTFLPTQNQHSFELTKEKVSEQIQHKNLIKSYLIENKEDANIFFKDIFEHISKKPE